MELWETHCHTSEVSGCARSTAAELVKAYQKAGYTGMVITDHFEQGTFQQRCPYDDWEQKITWYLHGYESALATGKELGMRILWGLELRFSGSINDFLVYGITKEQLLEVARENMLDWGIAKFSAYARERGILVFAAHPFRFDCVLTRPEFVDGVEVYNGGPNHDSHNQLAMWWAERYGLLKSSGSDSHIVDYVARGGIMTQQTILDMKNFCEVLRDPETRLILRK